MDTAPQHTLRACDRRVELGPRPVLMGILNATPDSFSDSASEREPAARAARGRALTAAGAEIIDVGGESGVTNRPAVDPGEEIGRVVPLIAGLAGAGAAISVDTYKPAVAAAAVDAGAVIVNDPSGLADPGVAEVCASTGAALVVTHTRARPKERRHPRYEDVVDDVKAFLSERIEVARGLGVADEQLLICPGPDMGKAPADTIEMLRRLRELHALGRPILLCVSRKDFIGALTGTPPRLRLAGTLAAADHCLRAGGHVLRVHDVAAVRDYLTVRAALAGESDVPGDLALADELRREPIESAA
jgi:dihydropteroate synthase